MGVVERGELSRYCCLELPIESSCQIYYTTNIPPKHHEILHYFDLRRRCPRWRRHVWNEEDAKAVGRTQGHGILLRRKHDENLLAKNEEGCCKMYRNGHARTRSSNVQIPTQIRPRHAR